MLSILLTTLAAVSSPQTDPGHLTPEAVESIAPAGVSMEALTEISDRLLMDEPGDGRTWARGLDWKASFGPEGMTYIPLFGGDTPQSYPIEFDLQHASIGGESLGLGDRHRGRSGSSVTLDRGTLQEVYHLTRETVEQTFVLNALPAHGALTLELAVKTELHASPAPGGGIDFRNEFGRVHYGTAIAVDANGVVFPMEQHLEEAPGGTVIQLRMPENSVASARLPLLVDPILSTFSVFPNVRRYYDMDVAYEASSGVYQIVFTDTVTGNDRDVIVVSYDAELDTVFSVGAIDLTSERWSNVANASAYHEQQFLCVALTGILIDLRQVWGRTRDANTGFLGPQFQISDTGAEFVDVGGKGNDASSSFDYMVVWRQAEFRDNDLYHNIVAQAVSGDSTLSHGRRFIDRNDSRFDNAPSISKSSGHPDSVNSDNEYMIVWERETASGSHNLRAQVMEYTGTLAGHDTFNAYTFSDSIDPDVSSVSNSNHVSSEKLWVIAFERLVGVHYEIFTVVARDGSADNARSLRQMQNLDPDRDHRDPVIANDSEDFLIAYQTELPGDRYGIHLSAVNIVRDGAEYRTGVSLRRDTFDFSDGERARIALASRWDGGGPFQSSEEGDAIAIWTAAMGTPGDRTINGATCEELSRGVTGSQFCEAALNSTGASAFIFARGLSWSPGSPLQLQSVEMPPHAFGHFLVSSQSGFVTNPGGSDGNLCLRGSVGRFNRPGEVLNSGSDGSFLLDVNALNFPSPLGAVAAAPGETWYFQCWFRDVGPSSNFSNGISMTFD